MQFIRRSVFLRRLLYRRSHPYGSAGQIRALVTVAVLLLAVLIVTIPVRAFFVELAGSAAITEAIDIITVELQNAIGEKMRAGEYDYDYFISMQKDDAGNISAISANMARINMLTAEILHEVIGATNSGEFDLEIPVGSLLGSNLTLGRGPKIPIKIIMLTSSHAGFRNDFTSVGINQSKHQIVLELKVVINVLMPWEIRTTQVESDVIIAETIIVGKVPDTYLDFQP